MALGDYILCCECECKLIYDGDRGQREWWHDRWGKEPQIKCPDCEPPQRQPLTLEKLREHWQVAKVLDMTDAEIDFADYVLIARDVEALHGIKGEA